MSDARRNVVRWSRDVHKGEFTDEARAVYESWVERKDEFPTLPTTSRLQVCPCSKYGSVSGIEKKCDPTKIPAHSTCGPGTNPAGGLCWTWVGCDDPDCDHPACEGKGHREFREWWNEKFGETSFRMGEGVIVWTSPWESWLDSNQRHPILLAEYRAGDRSEADPAKLLRRLEKGPCYPVQLGEGYLDMELALADQGVPLEERTIAETTEESIAWAVCRGEAFEDIGGSITNELRLARALDLAEAPDGYQGALF